MGAAVTPKDDFHAISLSGGKDSTCLALLMIERGLPIDAVIWADTGMEFPEMYDHIAKVDEYSPQTPPRRLWRTKRTVTSKF